MRVNVYAEEMTDRIRRAKVADDLALLLDEA